MAWVIYFVLVLLSISTTSIYGISLSSDIQCTSSSTVGESDPNSFSANVESSSGQGYLVEAPTYQVGCCGVVKEWEFYAKRTGNVDCQIWRKTSSTVYELVGENTINPGGTGEYRYTVSTAERISVRSGDYIGWYTSAQEMISYDTGSTYPALNRRNATGDLVAGATLNWSTMAPTSNQKRQYAIKAVVGPGDDPEFKFGASTTVTVPESAASGDAVLTLTVQDDDPGDTLTVETSFTDSTYFTLDATTNQIKTTQNDIPEGTYKMGVVVYDDCYQLSTATITLSVPNEAITIDNIPSSVTISEDETKQQKLKDIDVTELQDVYTCRLDTTTIVPFLVRQILPPDNKYGVYLIEWPQLDYSTHPSYSLDIECDDGTATTTETLTVNIDPNGSPSITNTVWVTTIDASTAINSDVIYTVTTSDPEGDQITFTMTCTPSGCPFDILNSGKIVLNDRVLRHSRTSYTVDISISDGHTTVVPRSLDVTINNINDDPVFSNLPASVNVIENSNLGQSIFTASVTDTDSGDPRIFTASFDPAWGAKYFTIDESTGVVSTSALHNIDHDVLPSVSISMFITATDGKWYDTKALSIQVQNENEPPAFSQTHYSTTRDEGSSGSTFPIPRYEVRDPDSSDTTTFSLDCGSETYRFSITSATGEISFIGEYDLDDGITPSSVVCTVTVRDKAGLIDTCNITLTVRHVNEFTPSFFLNAYPVTVQSYEAFGKIVTSIPATDGDLTTHAHGKIFYSLDDGNNPYFDVLQNGSIYVKSDLSPLFMGHSVVLQLRATDGGSPGLYSEIPVTISVPQSTTNSIVTTETPYQIFEKSESMAWVVPTVIACLAFVCAVTVATYLCITKCRKPRLDCCRKKKKIFRPKPVMVNLPKPKEPPCPKPMVVTESEKPKPQKEKPVPKPPRPRTPAEERTDLVTPVDRPRHTPIENKGLPSPGYQAGQTYRQPISPPPKYVEKENVTGRKSQDFDFWTSYQNE